MRRMYGYEGQRFVAYFWFVGWDCLSLGAHICFGAPNIEIHVPFGFFRVGRKSKPTPIWIGMDFSTLPDMTYTPAAWREGGVMSVPTIDVRECERVTKLIESVRAAGFTEAAEVFSNSYWGFLKVTSAYCNGSPYVEKPEEAEREGMTPWSALHITNFTIDHWAPRVPGAPLRDNAAVLQDAEDDAAWHHEEDRRMRRAAGEEI